MLISKILTLHKRPIGHLPCPGKATLAVRCCPVYFELRRALNKGTVHPLGIMIFTANVKRPVWLFIFRPYDFIPKPFNIP